MNISVIIFILFIISIVFCAPKVPVWPEKFTVILKKKKI
jgi:hypothetical protein